MIPLSNGTQTQILSQLGKQYIYILKTEIVSVLFLWLFSALKMNVYDSMEKCLDVL